jgi:putative hemolysin
MTEIEGTSIAYAAAKAPAHVVNVLIEERARHLKHNALAWMLVRFALYPLLRYRAAIAMADQIAAMPGRAVFDLISRRLALSLRVKGIGHVPRQGACIVVANHPTGIADGVALYQALKDVRDDLVFVANQDALRVAPRLAEMIVPVEWVIDKRSLAKTRQMWRQTREAFAAGHALVMFPSGRVAQLRAGRLHDRPWQAATIAFARRNSVPVVPLHIEARNSWIYYLFSAISPELRDMTLFNELLNKRGKTFGLTFGPIIPSTELTGDPDEEILRLRKYVEEDLPAGRGFAP